MPTKEAHLAAAEHNQNAIDCFREKIDQFPGWIAVIAFYKAVHLVEAVFAADNHFHSRDHAARNDTLIRTARYRNLWKHYKPIWQASLAARYMNVDGKEYPTFEKYMSPQKVEQKILNHDLRQIENSAQKLMGLP